MRDEYNKIHKEKDSFDSRSVAISCLIITGSILFWIKQVDKEGKLRKETYEWLSREEIISKTSSGWFLIILNDGKG